MPDRHGLLISCPRQTNHHQYSRPGRSRTGPFLTKSIFPMIAKFDIDYIIHPQRNKRVGTHRTNDPVAAEDFLTGLLASGAAVTAIRHEGVALSQAQSDQMIKVAAERLISTLLCRSLDIDAAAEKHRFGFAA